MKILFCICEGAHDTQFIRRTLIASGKYKKDDSAITQYKWPLPDFFISCFKDQNWDSIHLGIIQATILPSTSVKSIDGTMLVLLFNVGGDGRKDHALKIINFIFDVSDPSIIKVKRLEENNEYSIVFFFDADDMGKDRRLAKFCEDYGEIFGGLTDFRIEHWEKKKGINLGLFIFTKQGSEKGTLEDILIQLFDANKQLIVTASYDLLDNFSDHKQESIAERAKQAKSALTICGQTEKINAGSSLASVIKDCKILTNSFTFDDNEKIWCRIVKMVDEAFHVDASPSGEGRSPDERPLHNQALLPRTFDA